MFKNGDELLVVFCNLTFFVVVVGIVIVNKQSKLTIILYPNFLCEGRKTCGDNSKYSERQ